MSAGLETNPLIVTGVVGILMLLLGLGLSHLRYRRRARQMTTRYERQVQMLQQAMTDRSQEVQAQKAALTQAGRRLAEREAQLQTQSQLLQQANEDRQRAQETEGKVLELTQDLAAIRQELANAEAEKATLRAESKNIRNQLSEQTTELSRWREEVDKQQQRITHLIDETEEHRALLAQVRLVYEQEVMLRQNITAEISAIYYRLQSGSPVASEFPTADGLAPVAHDAMDSETTGSATPASAEQMFDPAATSTALVAVNGKSATLPPASVDPTTANEHSKGSSRLVHFLAGRGITITQIPTEESFDPVLNGLANFLGTHYESLRPLYQQIKRNMQMGDDFAINLKEESPKTISLICQFGKKLYDVAFLEQYRYIRSPQYLLRAKTTRLPTAQNFFSGQWLERYVMQQVQEAVEQLQSQSRRQIDCSYLANPRITLANQQEGELDFLFHIDQNVYWIETKSGDYQQHISKYSMIARTLNLDEKHAIMVLTDIPASRSAELTALFGMGVCALSEFRAALLTTMKQDLGETQGGS
ncbi:MAG: hypothetical protein KDE19_14325 [Caldilineaceae bacterium]|nr:hypothetical protein [Caldilineaceae bacterium]